MSDASGEPRSPKPPRWLHALIVLACLALALGVLFRDSLDRGQVLFANDYPLAAIQSHALDEQEDPWSFWQDQNWLGGELPSATPNFTLLWVRLCLWVGGDQGAVLFAKTYAPMALLLLGFSGWLLFRVLRFSQPVCVLGALALALNGDLLTHATWGLPSVALGAAGTCLCLAAVFHGLRQAGWRAWAWTALGGLALGQGVMESFDVGGIFSLCVAAVVFVAVLNRDSQKAPEVATNSLLGVAKVAVVALAAALMAGHTLSNLLRTEAGAAMAQGQEMSPEQKWDFATQWSVPPGESLRLAIPGLYGYYMKPHGWLHLPVAEGDTYWGAVGQEPVYARALEQHPRSHQNALGEYSQKTGRGAPGISRWAYCGIYVGVLALLVAAWALAQCLCRDSVYSPAERRWIWVWTLGALACLVLSWGHHAPFYQVIYQLPFFDTIRNPIKFIHPLSVALGVLFAYGLEGISRAYLSEPSPRITLRQWFAQLAKWDQRWLQAMAGVVVVAGLAWAVYFTAQQDLRMHLADSLGFEPEPAKAMARQSAWAAGAALVALGLSVAWLVVAMTGRCRAGLWVAGGVLLCLDLGRASAPYIVHFNHHTQYASNDIIRILARQPWAQRVQFQWELFQLEIRILQMQMQQLIGEHQGTADPAKKQQLALGINNLAAQANALQMLSYLYQSDWKQGLFPWNRIHTVDTIQEPRRLKQNDDFRNAFKEVPAQDRQEAARQLKRLRRKLLRTMELTSTRWMLCGRVSIMPHLPAFFDTHTNAFTLRESFNLIPRPGATNAPPRYTAVAAPGGLLALIEFEDALPRAGLYAHWRSGVADETALATLPNPEWDPHREVLVAEKIPAPDFEYATVKVVPARYEFYDPKRVVISTDAETSTVLMLNDKHHPEWEVTVDGKPAKLLRANYLMRGVHLSPGKHTVEFKFAPKAGSIRFSLAGLGLAGVLGALLIFIPARPREEEAEGDNGDDGPEEIEVEVTGPSDDPETPTADDTSSPDAPPATSRRKSRSRSGRRKKR